MPYPQFQMLCRKIIAICIARRTGYRKRHLHQCNKLEFLQMFPEHRWLFLWPFFSYRKQWHCSQQIQRLKLVYDFSIIRPQTLIESRLRALNIAMWISRASAEE
ncbi:hypothetical protein CQ054_19910 [Ochrobactrum sp. MYb29]|nr:hypothetical protein CWE02_06255 [Brucella pituitosa]PRA82573.1 hypothetical protein CQ054_19910 [Ochrobactrum sp. MYb29]